MTKEEIEIIKSKVDIISLAESYGFEFSGTGNRLRAKENLFRDENTSSLDFFQDSNRYFDRGNTSIRGDVIDLIMWGERCDYKEAVKKANDLAGGVAFELTKQPKRNTKTKTTDKKKVDFTKLNQQAISEISASNKTNPFCILENLDKNNDLIDTSIMIDRRYEKLFEGYSFPTHLYNKFKYLFEHIIGWSEFWNSPTIILKDSNGRVVDIVAYRPKDKETKEEIKGMKYYYKNFKDRGDSFLYPFQKEVEKIAFRERYILVGEGLKNALNALIYGVPFITIESTGNTLNLSNKLIEKIKEYIKNGYGVATAFDGDEAGEKAYQDFLELVGIDVENVLNFNSNQDFVEYLRAN